MIRRVFLAGCDTTRPLLASGAVAAAWGRPAALAQMTVGSLAGHLMRAVTSVDAYLDRPPPASDHVLDAAGYLLSIEGLSEPDLGSDLHVAIRDRASDEAAAGHTRVVDRWDATVNRLRGRLAVEPDDRVLPALGGRSVSLDEYLVTRLVEMLVHADDLAVSVGETRPDFDPAADDAVIGCLVEVARRRHGAPALITALTRRERDTVQALRVL